MKLLSIDPGKRNMSMCISAIGEHPGGDSDVVHHWTLVSIPELRAAKTLLDVMELELESREFDEVVIEIQPSKNPGMKKMEYWLQMYFAMKNVPCHSMQATEKLKFAVEAGLLPQTSSHRGKSYYQRKKMSVEAVTPFLDTQTEDIRTIFEASKKKDDLADSLLQALAWGHKSANHKLKNDMPPSSTRPQCPSQKKRSSEFGTS